MIVASNLEKRYAAAHALRGVSFTARPGEVTGFLGPNGAGKTTTLRILAGYLAPSAGRVTVDGIDVADDPRGVRARLGYLPESVPLYPEMRVGEYLRYRAALKGVPSRERGARVEEAAARVGLDGALGRIVGQLSRGYRQRVGLADALTHRPSVLVLDEPTEGLDPNQRRELLEVVRSLGAREGRTVLLSTHVLPEAETLCDRVVVLDGGRVVAAGTPAELGAVSGGGEVRVRVEVRGGGDVAAALGAVTGVLRVEPLVVEPARESSTGATADEPSRTLRALLVVATRDCREELGRAAIADGATLRELRLAPAGLDDVFARLTRGAAPAAAASPSTAATSSSNESQPAAEAAPSAPPPPAKGDAP